MHEWFENRPERMPLERLVHRAGQAIGRHYQQTVSEYGLSWASWGVLGALSQADALSHRELAARIGVTPASLTPVIDVLAAGGELTRERDPTDRRVVRLSITAHGRERIAAAAGPAGAGWRARIPRPGPEVAEHVRGYLLAVLTALEDGPER